MEACRICKGEQDTRYFKGYNICTEFSEYENTANSILNTWRNM